MVQTRTEGARGCGWRTAGGLYLVAPGGGTPCGLMPIPLDRCPTCDAGIKISRGWTWVDPEPLLAQRISEGGPCPLNTDTTCAECSVEMFSRGYVGKVGLLWVGEKFYDTPGKFLEEADRMGICRRIKSVPHDFVLGETWIWLAHRCCIPTEDEWQAGVFRIFKPEAIEYIVTGKETEEELERMVERGITPVKIEREESDE